MKEGKKGKGGEEGEGVREKGKNGRELYSRTCIPLSIFAN